MDRSPPPYGGRTRLILLAAGAVLGLLAAAMELVDVGARQSAALPDRVVARVGGRDISLERYLAVLGDLEADRTTPLTPADRDRALQRLIDEELLVLRGLEMGLAESLPGVRKVMVSAVIAQTVAEAEAIKPSERQLRELFESDPAFFTRAARYRVVWLRGSVGGKDAVAGHREDATPVASGAGVETVAAANGFERVTALPDALLPLAKLQDYLGPVLATAVSELAPGTAVGPIAHAGAAHILYLAGFQPPELPPFERIRPLVEAEFTRRQGDAALRRQLERLRQDFDVVVDTARQAEP